ncbi:MAG: AEC family transporter [Bacteroidales bacterium]|nr:AEC family transporter [Bacteroidales bacterium]MCF8344730.1 AEC family transporter [Bacteroidales bacterium]MCF8350219.1 AEC family transporter [Bacteroidales bacterium]MCF8375836.1 AEC family transporter [Bacteroidales bacterium]MCF8402271.1 AEC family transporter [Bacteroidales bacterium]
MQHFYSLLESVMILVVLIGTTFWLKKRGVVNENLKGVFSKMTTDYALPALIFANLSTRELELNQLLPVVLMLGSILITMVFAYIGGKILKLSTDRLGVFIILAGFGSSSSLGYPLVKQVFPNSCDALADAMLIGELGACLPFFIIGVAVLIYFGKMNEGRPGLGATLLPFLRSPIFISMVLGLIASMVGLPRNYVVVDFVLKVFNLIGASLMVFVAISIGLMLKPVSFRSICGSVYTTADVFVECLLKMAGDWFIPFNRTATH